MRFHAQVQRRSHMGAGGCDPSGVGRPHIGACMVNGRLRIPCGNGFVTLPAMSGIG